LPYLHFAGAAVVLLFGVVGVHAAAAAVVVVVVVEPEPEPELELARLAEDYSQLIRLS
jgi:hypothetical protein